MKILIILITVSYFSIQMVGQVESSIDNVDKELRNDSQKLPLINQTIEETAPQILEDELFDLGPQFLLKEKQKRFNFLFESELRFSVSSNTTFVEDDPDSSTLTIFSNTLSIAPSATKSWNSGNLSLKAGLRYQFFRYGLLSDDNKLVSNLAVDSNDFDTFVPFANINYLRKNFFSSLSLRYLNIENRATDSHSYNEIVPYWTAGLFYNLSINQSLLIKYDGNWRETDTESAGLQADGWNDRSDHAISLIYRISKGKLIFEPSIRFQYSKYTYSTRDRDDYYAGISGSAYYSINQFLTLRVFSTYEFRESSETTTADYELGEIGLNLNANFRF